MNKKELETLYENLFLKVKKEKYRRIHSFFNLIIEQNSKELIFLFFQKNKKTDINDLVIFLHEIETHNNAIFFDTLSLVFSLYSKHNQLYSSKFYHFLISYINKYPINRFSHYKIINSFFQQCLKNDSSFIISLPTILQNKGYFISEQHTLYILHYIFNKYPDFFLIFINSYYKKTHPLSNLVDFSFVFKSDIVKQHLLKYKDKYLNHPDIIFLRIQYNIENF